MVTTECHRRRRQKGHLVHPFDTCLRPDHAASVADGGRHGGRHASRGAGSRGAAASSARRGRRRARHALAAVPVKHRWWLLVAAVVALAVAVPALGAVTGPTPADDTAGSCVRPTQVAVAVDPALAAPVRRVVARDVQPALGCVHVAVSARPSAQVAAEVSRRSGQGLAGALPDVWLPESRLWLTMARATKVGVARLADGAPAVATSPVVLALPTSTAANVTWPPKGPPISALLASPTTQGSVALADPATDSAGLATLVQVGDAAPRDQAAAAIADIARKVRVLHATDPLAALAAGRVGAVTTTERAVVQHNGAADARKVAAYGGPAPAVSQVPLAVLRPGTGTAPPPAAVREAGRVLRRALLADAGQRALMAVGFRGRDGHLGAAYEPAGGLSANRLPRWSDPSSDVLRGVVGEWGKIGRRGRVLVAIDESGSMADRLPGGALTKSQLARQALAVVASGIAPDSDMGLWTFTASRGRDYQERVPLGPADDRFGSSTRRAALQREIAGLRPVLGGGTGLYDTILAAYRAASKGYVYGRLNAVLVITDGRNQDPGSISLDQLLSTLRREYDGIKPVRIITSAYGTDADLPNLKRIADVTGGASYSALQADQVAPLLARALSDL
jgi:hypothetical protein